MIQEQDKLGVRKYGKAPELKALTEHDDQHTSDEEAEKNQRQDTLSPGSAPSSAPPSRRMSRFEVTPVASSSKTADVGLEKVEISRDSSKLGPQRLEDNQLQPSKAPQIVLQPSTPSPKPRRHLNIHAESHPTHHLSLQGTKTGQIKSILKPTVTITYSPNSTLSNGNLSLCSAGSEIDTAP